MSTQKVKEEDQGDEVEKGEEQTEVKHEQEKDVYLKAGDKTAANDDEKGDEAGSGEGGEEGHGNDGRDTGDHQFEDADAVPTTSAAQQPLSSTNPPAPYLGGDRGADSAATLSTLAYYQAMGAATNVTTPAWQGTAAATTIDVSGQHSTHRTADLSHQTLLPSVLSPTVPAWGGHQAYARAASPSAYPSQYSASVTAAGPPAHDLGAIATYAAASAPVLSVANASSEHYAWWAKYYQQYYQIMAYRAIPGIPTPPPPNPWSLPSVAAVATGAAALPTQQLHQSTSALQHQAMANNNMTTIPIDMVPPRTSPIKRQRIDDGGVFQTSGATRAIGTSPVQTGGGGDGHPGAQEDREDDAVNSLTKMYQC